MALNIKDPQTDRLVRELADLADETITVAIRRAAEERLARLRARARSDGSMDRLQEIIDRGRACSALDDRSADEIIGYDEFGLPT